MAPLPQMEVPTGAPAASARAASSAQASAGDDDRPARGGQEGGGLFHSGGVGTGAVGGIRAARRLRVERRGLDRARQDVHGQGELHRPRPAAGGHTKGLAHGGGDAAGLLYQGGPLGDGFEERRLVQGRQDVAVLSAHGRVGQQGNDGDGRGVGLGQAGGQVSSPCPAGALAHAGPEADPGIDVGHVGGRAFVAGQNVADLARCLAQGIVERQAGVAGNAKDVPHLIGLEHLHEKLATVEFHGNPPRSPVRAGLGPCPTASSKTPSAIIRLVVRRAAACLFVLDR
jgi:hypothetical protein